MSSPVRVQLRRSKGWKMPPNTFKVTRPGVWGNPFRFPSIEAPDAATAVALYREHIKTCPQLIADAKRYLRGKNLACWCPVGAPCHADVLLEIANAPEAST